MLYPGQTLVVFISLNPNELLGIEAIKVKVFYDNHIENILACAGIFSMWQYSQCELYILNIQLCMCCGKFNTKCTILV